MINIKIAIVVTIFVLYSISCLFSQNDTLVLDLKQAQSIALANNQNIKNAQIDLKIAKKKIWETTAMGLPQVSGQISYNDMLDIPTTLIPDFISPAVYGVLLQEGLIPPSHMPNGDPQYFPAKFGTQHNASYKIQASQLIFNGAYIVGLQASKIFYQLSNQNSTKKKQETLDNVTSTYYLVLVANESVRILDSSYKTIEKSAFDIEQIAKNGLADETDAEQLKMTALNIKNTLERMKRQAEVSERLLKFQMGVDIDKPLKLTDQLDLLLGQINFTSIIVDTFQIQNNINYKLIETQEKLTKLNFQREKSSFLPSVVGFFSFQKSAQRSEFDIFDSNKPWYPTKIIGITIDIPIFSSGQRLMKAQEAKLELEKLRNTKQQVTEGLKMDYMNARNAYLNSYENYIQNKESYQLATKVYNKWKVKFVEGVASSIELTTQQNQYLTAQANYYNSIFELLSAKVKLERILNNE